MYSLTSVSRPITTIHIFEYFSVLVIPSNSYKMSYIQIYNSKTIKQIHFSTLLISYFITCQ